MATYKDIFGTNIQVVSSDPANPVEGQIWYNTTTGALKGQALIAGSWATGGNMAAPRRFRGSAGTQTAGLAFGGTPITATTESYNGTSWTEVNDLNTIRTALGGSGIQTAALGFGGIDPSGPTTYNATESWNGTNWTTSPATLNTARWGLSNTNATSTDVLAFTGQTSPSPTSALNESYNGTSWTEVNDLNTPRLSAGGAGSGSTDALCYGGYTSTPGGTGSTEFWNGTSWTEVNDLNVIRTNMSGGIGTVSNAALCLSGELSTSAFESWNGTCWAIEANPAVGGQARPGTGTATEAIAFGGFPGTTATEEWTGAALGTVTLS